jgi:hypothetical protein
MMMTHTSTNWRPIAHIAVQDVVCRAAVVETLRRRGWSVVEQPTGLHLIHAISGIILGDQPSLQPGLIVADAIGRGCNGESIALGLRDLGLRIPIVLITSSKNTPPPRNDGAIMIVDPAHAASAVARLVRSTAAHCDDLDIPVSVTA